MMRKLCFGLVFLVFWALSGESDQPRWRFAWAREGYPTTLTDSLSSLPPGRGCLAAVHQGSAPLWREVTLPNDGPSFSQKLAARPGVRVTGQVVTHDLASYVPEVHLSAREGALPPLCWQALGDLGWTTSSVDRAGAFSLGPLPPGKWELAIKAPFHLPVVVPLEVKAEQSELLLGVLRLAARGYLRVELAGPQAFDASLEVERIERQPSGRVSFTKVEQRPVQAGDAPTLQLEPGPYRLVLQHPQLGPVAVETTEVHVGEQTPVMKATPIEVEGRVRANDTGVEGAELTVALFPELTSLCLTEKEGRFQLVVPQPQTYLVEVRLSDGRFEPAFLDLRDASPGERVLRDIEIENRWLSGLVVESDGQPVSQAKVLYRLHRQDRAEEFSGSVTAGDDGRFSVPLKRGARLSLMVGRNGFLPLELSWDHNPPKELTIRLEKGLEVNGRVLGPNGQGVAAAGVTVAQDPFGRSLFTTRCGEGGAFSLTVPYHSALVAWTPGVGLVWGTAQEAVTLQLRPAAPASFLTLVTPEKEPLGRALATVISSEGIPIPHWVLAEMERAGRSLAATDDQGRLRITSLPPGSYTLIVRTRDQRLWSGVVVFPFSGSLTLQPASIPATP